MKKFALAMIAILSCCMFFSCGKPSPNSNEYIMLSLATDESGMINQGLHYSVGSEKLKTAGLSEEQIEQFKSRLIENIKVFHDEYYLGFLVTYANQPLPEFRIGKAVIVTDPVYTSKTDSIGFNMLFTSQAAWNFYHQTSTSDGGDSGIKTKYGFMTTTSQSGTFPFSAQIGETYVAQRFFDAYNSALGETQIDYDPDFVYDYATPSRYLKSNSDYSFESGLYHHVWMRKTANLSNSKITLYTSFPNTPVWYATLLSVTVFGTCVALVIIKYKNSKKNI